MNALESLRVPRGKSSGCARTVPLKSRPLAVPCLLTGALLLSSAAALGQTVDEDLWVTDGPVYSVVHHAGTVYMGGAFARVGPPTGGGVPVSVAAGTLPAAFPKVAGNVFAVVSDGGTGWYIGGDFVSVGGVPRSGLAHVAGNLTVSSWDPDIGHAPGQNPIVRALARLGSTVYVGGEFSLAGGQTRNNLAAIHGTTGAALSWNPSPNDAVHAIFTVTLNGIPDLYVGGSFTEIAGVVRNRIARFEPVSGQLTPWAPSANGPVYALALGGFTQSIMYAGGAFSTMNGSSTGPLAAINTYTAESSPALNPNGHVYALAFDDDAKILYVGGAFSMFGGMARNHLGMYSLKTQYPYWNPSPNGVVRTLVPSGSTLYVGGDFTSIGGSARNYAGAVSTPTGLAEAWNPNANGAVRALAMNASSFVYAGGDFRSIGGVARGNLAALDAATGQPTAWNPDANAAVYSLAMSGPTLYAGGNFTTIGGLTRNRIAALDATSGAASDWNPNANNTVFALAVDGSTVYAAGFVTVVGGKVRKRLAALDAITGLATDWNPSITSSIYDKVLALVVDGSTVYAGGSFSTVGGQTRNNLAAIDASTGLVTSWNPGANAAVSTLVLSGSTVYAGGEFSAAGGQSRSHVASLDAATGQPTAWNPGANGSVNALLLDGAVLYAGGHFTSIGGESRNRLAALDAATGVPAVDWEVDAEDDVFSLAVGGPSLFAGGAFRDMSDKPQCFIAAIGAAPNPTAVGDIAGAQLALSFRANPARDRLTVLFSLPDAAPARIELFDVSGRRIAERDVGGMGAGSHAVTLGDGRTLSPGIYMVRVSRGGRSITARAAVLK